MKRLFALLLAAVLAAALLGTTAFAADTASAVIDSSRTGSLTIFKYDGTNAAAAGWTAEAHKGSGERSTEAEQALASYALQGVEFTYLKAADFIQGENPVEVKFAGISDGIAEALGLDAGTAYRLEDIQNALKAKLASNAAAAKNALEAQVKANGTAMPETGADGKTSAAALPLGLYLIVETRVPENVVSTTAPFFVSLPLTNADGTDWVYDAYVYPKNQTGSPTLDKTVREAPESGGKTENYAEKATASVGDVLNFHICSTLPNITSEATYLTEYTFADTVSAGMTYVKNDVEITVQDAQGGSAVWKADDDVPKFTVAYGADTMTIAMTEAGLAQINSACAGCPMCVSYSCILNEKAVLGDDGNPNTVELTWKRTNTAYSDTLSDGCFVFSYGLDVTKEFSDGQGDLSKVEFVVKNLTDGGFITAALTDGVWQATGLTDDEAAAAHFTLDADGRLTVRGLEDDEYAITEVQTAPGYNLLKDDIHLVITAEDAADAARYTASAAVNGTDTEMTEDNGSLHAFAAFKVINDKPEIPDTGDVGNTRLVCFGVIGIAAALLVLLAAGRKKKSSKA